MKVGMTFFIYPYRFIPIKKETLSHSKTVSALIDLRRDFQLDLD
jgi:hypothetical protein